MQSENSYDKGKVESNVKYVKDNCFKGRDFKDLHAAQDFLKVWLRETANKRIRGTTYKEPEVLFLSREKQHLKPLPKEPFYIANSTTATVRTDCHITYKKNHYSVPYTYIGTNVRVIECNHLLKIYAPKEEKEIALHVLLEHQEGEYSTDKSHYPNSKKITQTELQGTRQKWRASVRALCYSNDELKQTSTFRGHHYRSILGIISLKKKYGIETVNNAYMRALWYNSLSYGAVKRICEKGLYSIPMDSSDDNNYSITTQMIDLKKYSDLSEAGVIEHE